MKRRTALLLAVLLLLGLLAGCTNQHVAVPARTAIRDLSTGFEPAPEEGGLTKISENSRFILYADLSQGEAAIEDKAQGTTWYSNPEDKSQDGLASGFHKNALQSVLTVVYTTELSVDMTCGGFMSSVRKDGLSYRLEGDGSVTFLFDFPAEQFMIPVNYAIREDCFAAAVIADWVFEYGTNQIKSIDLLPFFGAGSAQDQGYLFVPDGSGALIRFNNQRLTASSYSRPLYGYDSGLSDKVSQGVAMQSVFTVAENQNLPVFGEKRNEAGFLAVITEGAARAAVNANVAGKYTQYNTVWPTYNYRSVGSVSQTQKDGSETVTKVAEKNLELWQDFTVCYYFLENGRSGYSDMAAFYRQYLTEQRGLTPRVQAGELPFYLDLYGYIVKTKSLLGIPVDKKLAVCSAEDADVILNLLGGLGVSRVVLKYNYWSKGSFYGKIPVKADPEGTVGSKKELLALQDRLSAAGGDLYLSADLMNVYKGGNGVSQYGDALRSVANTTQRQYAFNMRSGLIDARYDPWFLLRPGAIGRVFRTYAGNLTGAGFRHFAIDGAGEMLYSELGSSGVGRNQMVGIMKQALADAAQAAEGLMLSNANDYAAVYASHIVSAPSKASNFDLEDESIPFYEMVFHGYVPYSLSAWNLSSSPADTALRHLEYGAGPMFSLVAQNVDELIGSRLDRLFSADAAQWLDTMAAQYQVLNAVLGPVQDSVIMEHRILSEDVRAVTYANGITIYVNYGAAPAEAEGVTLEPYGYASTQDGRVLASGTAAPSA